MENDQEGFKPTVEQTLRWGQLHRDGDKEIFPHLEKVYGTNGANLIVDGPDNNMRVKLFRAMENDDQEFIGHFTKIFGDGSPEHFKEEGLVRSGGAFDTAVDHVGDFFQGISRGGIQAGVETAETVADLATTVVGSDVNPEFDATPFLDKYLPTDSITGDVAEGLTQFLAPYGVAAKATRLATAPRTVQIVGGLGLGALTDFAAFEADDNTLTQTLSEQFGVDVPVVTDYLTKDDTDGEYEKRFKSALEGAALGGALEGVLLAAGKLTRARNLDAPEAVIEAERNALNKAIEDIPDELYDAPQADVVTPADTSRGPETPIGFTDVEVEKTGRVEPVPMAQKFQERLSGSESTQMKAAVTELQKVVAPIDAIDRDEVLKKTAREQGIGVDEGQPKTNLEQAQVARAQYDNIMGRMQAGDENGVIEMARKSATEEESLARLTAFSAAHKVAKEQVDQLAQRLADLPLDSPYAQDLAEIELEQLFRNYVFIGKLDTDLKSSAGRQLQAAQSKVDIRDVEGTAEFTADPKKPDDVSPVVKENAKSNLKSELEAKEKRFQELKSMGLSGADAIRLMNEKEWETFIYGGKTPQAKKDLPKTTPAKALNTLEKIRYNFMLSGTATQLVNAVSGVLQTVQRTASEGGAALTGDDYGKAFVTYLGKGLGDSFKAAGRSWNELRPILSDSNKFETNAAGIQKWEIIMRAMTASDEFFRQLNYRADVSAQAYEAGKRSGLEGDDLTKFIDSEVNASFDEVGGAVDVPAEKRAAAITFQRFMDNKSIYAGERFQAAIQNFSNANFVTRTLLPFARVATDIAEQSIRMTPGVNIAAGGVGTLFKQGHKAFGTLPKGFNPARDAALIERWTKSTGSKFFDDLAGKNGKRNRVKAMGDVSVGLALTGGAFYKASEGELTGGRRRNYLDAKTGETYMAPPYSIKIGDTWYSYERLQPWAYPLSVVAAYHDYMETENMLEDNNLGSEGFSAELTTLGYMVSELYASQSYAKSFQDIMTMINGVASGDEDNLDAISKYAVRTGGSFVFPNIGNKVAQAFDDGNYKQGNAVVRMILENGTFNGLLGYADDQKRSFVFGDVDEEDLTMGFFGSTAKATRELTAGEEAIRELHTLDGARFHLKAPFRFPGGEDIRLVPDSSGQRSLYDRYLAEVADIKAPEGSYILNIPVSGMGYKEALDAVTGTDDFKNMPWFSAGINRDFVTDAPTKKRIMQEVKETFEELATISLMKKEPNFKALYVNREQANQLEQINALEFFRGQ